MAEGKAFSAAGKQKYKWTDEEVEKLIDLYEERPCLWDISDSFPFSHFEFKSAENSL